MKKFLTTLAVCLATVVVMAADSEKQPVFQMRLVVETPSAGSEQLICQRTNKETGRIYTEKIYDEWCYTKEDKYLHDEEGTFVQFSPVLTLTRDTRDSMVMPTRGGMSTLMGKVGFGSEMYGLAEAKHEQYFKIFEPFAHRPDYPFSGPHVLEVRGAAGAATDSTPLFDRFFMGGPYELRGFGYRMAGPKDYSRNNALGGTTKLFGSLEYTFPIFAFSDKLSIRGALWADAGNVWWKSRRYTRAVAGPNGYYIVDETRDNSGEINLSAGMGLRVNLPLGLVRLDYGIPIAKDSESKDWKVMDGLSFNLGASF